MQTTVLVGNAFIPELAPVAVVLLLALAASYELAMARARFAELFPLYDVHIGARPEQIVTTPFVRLARQPDRAIRTGEVLGQRNLKLLSTAKDVSM